MVIGLALIVIAALLIACSDTGNYSLARNSSRCPKNSSEDSRWAQGCSRD